MSKRPEPINPWLAELIVKYRAEHDDEQIREDYRRFLELGYSRSWENFIATRALVQEMGRNPFLATRRVDMDLSDGLNDLLKLLYADMVADLMQFTEEEMKMLFNSRLDDIQVIRDYLGRYGLQLYHNEVTTYKIATSDFTPDERIAAGIQAINIDGLEREVEALLNGKDAFTERLKRACRLYEDAIRSAQGQGDDKDCLLLAQSYADFLREYIQWDDDFPAKAERYAYLGLSIASKVYGHRHERTGAAHRALAKLYVSMDRFPEAAVHYLESAAVVKHNAGVFDPIAGEDLEFAAYCYEKQERYTKALELYLMAYQISLSFPENSHVNPEPICFELSNVYMKLGDKVKAKEYMDLYEQYQSERK